MNRTVFCCQLKEEAEGLLKPPFPGELGEKIFQNVSKRAWNRWLNHQTMLINEYRLNLLDPKSRDFLKKELDQYFFGSGSETPSGYTPKK